MRQEQDASESVCAVVVTFHPEADVLANLAAARRQAGLLVVVDNGSSADELAPIRSLLADDAGAVLVEHGRNLGIATALNRGVHEGMERGFEWMLLFDQDSRVTDGFTEAMMGGFSRSRWGERLALLVPRYLDKRVGTALQPERREDGGLEVAMTSGSLLRAKTFQELGWFADELFIDAVDHEYSLRLRSAGYMVDECSEAVLLHSPGDPRVVRWRGRKLYEVANYSPARRYYQERNKIWLYRRYFGKFPGYCARLMLFSGKDLVKILISEDNARKKAFYFLRGVKDGLLGRMGGLE